MALAVCLVSSGGVHRKGSIFPSSLGTCFFAQRQESHPPWLTCMWPIHFRRYLVTFQCKNIRQLIYFTVVEHCAVSSFFSFTNNGSKTNFVYVS